MAVIEVTDLKKSYGDVHAVRGVSFAVDQGECVAVLGPNGAGKTTTVEILEGYRTRDAGTVSVLGVDPSTRRKRVSDSTSESCCRSVGVDPYLTVTEVLTMHAGYYRHPLARRPTCIDIVGLEREGDGAGQDAVRRPEASARRGPWTDPRS